MILALGGIIIVQVLWIENAIEQNAYKFDNKVNEALQKVVKKLEENNIARVFEKEMNNNYSLKTNVNISIDNTEDSTVFIKVNDTLLHKLIILNEGQTNKMQWLTNDTDIVVIKGSNNNSNTITTIQSGKTQNGSNFVFQSNYSYNDSTTKLIIKQKTIKTKAKKIENVIKKMVFEYDTDFNRYTKRLKFEILDSLLKTEFANNDITLLYEYGIKSQPKNSNKSKTESDNYNLYNDYKKYQVSLFPDDLLAKQDKLVVYFPERDSHLYTSLSIMLPSSLFFSLIILLAFSLSIRMLLKQKRISDIKTDFINNITHELKTPIATISLAADSIINPKVIYNSDKIKNFIKIIKDENKRMNKQIESVLQMSLLDKSELDLNMKKLDIHAIINNAIENISVQIEKKNGLISTELLAKSNVLFIDEIHFLNIINNLLDNALKYTNKTPEISIKTKDIKNGVLISVIDNGIGMSKDEQLKIFDRFYRVSKGNIHNTKGFGLGLSYVKAIIEAFKGNITVKSELNKGSRFDIFIPDANSDYGLL